MKLRKLLFFVCLIIFIIPQTYANSTAHLAILDTVNLSGIESVGNKKIAPVIDKLFSETLKKATPETIYNTETTRNLLKKEGLDLYYVARNLCTNEDLVKIGRKIGVNYLAILEIHGYSEISREKFKKNYQLLLGLKVINCSDGSESYYFGEGNHDKKRNEAYVDAVNQLVAAYLQNDTGVDINRNDLIQVVGNRLSKVYHRSDSSHLPKEEAQERFNLRTEAEANEYRACVACFPPYQHFYSRDRVLEEELGAEACGIIEHYYRLLYDAPELLTRVEEVAAPLIKNTIRKDVRYRFRILDTDEIQAWAAPNGFIYITKGLLDIVETDDELAMIIAHEMAHIEKKHSVIAYRRSVALSFLTAAIILGTRDDKDNDEAAIAAVVMSTLIRQGYSRSQEKEADEVGVTHLKRAGYDYQSYGTIFGKFIDLRKSKVTTISKLFATHPTPEERIANLDKYLKSYDELQLKLNY